MKTRYTSDKYMRVVWIMYIFVAIAAVLIYRYFKFIDISPRHANQALCSYTVFLAVLFLGRKFIRFCVLVYHIMQIRIKNKI